MNITFLKSFKIDLINRRYWLIPLIIWASVVSISLYQSISAIHEGNQEEATTSARHLFNIVRLTRHWNASHGGVYVPVSDSVEPNPYLETPNRDVETKNNVKLTLVNPAYMTRQLSELASPDGVTFHITSLNPIRPLNAPDPWEKEVLKFFEQDSQEQILSSKNTFRYMAPLWVKKPCLKCHEKQGYKLGDIHGGISITIPRAQISTSISRAITRSTIQHVGVFLIVSLITLLLMEQLRRSWQNLNSVRLQQEEIIIDRTNAISKINDRLREEINERNKAENIYRLVSQSAPEAIISANTSGKIISWNQGAEGIFGYSEKEMLGKRLEKIIPIRYQKPHQEAMNKAKNRAQLGQLIQGVEVEGVNHTGDEVPIEISLNDWQNGGERFYTAIIRDISERKKADESLRLSAKVFESTADGVIITDKNSSIIAVNLAFTRITGYSQTELVGKSPSILQSGRHDLSFYEEMWRQIVEASSWSGEIWNKRKNGEIYPERLNINAVHNETGDITHYVGVFSDISEIKRSQQQLDYLAHHDPLTDLPNRRLFNDRLKHAISRCKRRDEILVVMFIDLDNFKDINDTLGHAVGDQVLTLVAKRIVKSMRVVDTIARQGGDEFIVLLEDVKQIGSLEPLIGKLMDSLQQGHELGEHKVYTSASIGLSSYPNDGETPEILIQYADAAMYAAKEKGRNGYVFYSDELTSLTYERLQLKGNLRHAMELNEFHLYYQPQVNITTGETEGFEALLRWFNPNLGEVPPITFIPKAENSGLIIPIGAWVLQQACQQFMDWREHGLPIQYIAVNIAGQQIQDSGFFQMVSNTIENTGISPENLELEVTESFIMQRADNAIETLDNLKALGIRIAIDDFGTGYSSLSYLKRLPIDNLKIDRSFIRDLTIDPNDVAITRAIIALGQSMGLNIIAEGVETIEQQDLLIEYGCNHLQGYLYGHPIPASKVPELFS